MYPGQSQRQRDATYSEGGAWSSGQGGSRECNCTTDGTAPLQLHRRILLSSLGAIVRGETCRMIWIDAESRKQRPATRSARC